MPRPRPGAPEDLAAEADYLGYAEGLARSVGAGEQTPDEALASPLPDRFAEWSGPRILAANLAALLISAPHPA